MSVPASNRSLTRLIVLLTAFFLLGSSTVQSSEWLSVGTLSVPEYPYSFLAATPSGDLVAATFNSNYGAEGKARAMPALLVRNVMALKPEVTELCRTVFEVDRGYGGIACEPSGSFFVSGDTGTAATCYIRKFNPDGSPATEFGRNGEVLPNRRTLGIDVVGNFLLATFDWGEIFIFDTRTGAPLGAVPKPQGFRGPVRAEAGSFPPDLYVRDVAIDPKSMRIFGVAEGGIVTWGGAAPWRAGGYQFRQLSEQVGLLRSGEGISIDAIKRTALITPVPGNMLRELHGNGTVVDYEVKSASKQTHLCDSVVSFDGSTLFISDMTSRKIHMMRRDLASLIAQREVEQRQRVGTASAAPVAAGAGAEQVTWHPSYTDVVQKAREEGRSMIVYFRSAKVPKCVDFEKQVLLTDQFNAAAKDHICVFSNVTDNRLLAYRFGVYRVPHLAVLDPQGNTRAEFVWDINPAEVFGALQK